MAENQLKGDERKDRHTPQNQNLQQCYWNQKNGVRATQQTKTAYWPKSCWATFLREV